jgi:hypothetical protein
MYRSMSDEKLLGKINFTLRRMAKESQSTDGFEKSDHYRVLESEYDDMMIEYRRRKEVINNK